MNRWRGLTGIPSGIRRWVRRHRIVIVLGVETVAVWGLVVGAEDLLGWGQFPAALTGIGVGWTYGLGTFVMGRGPGRRPRRDPAAPLTKEEREHLLNLLADVKRQCGDETDLISPLADWLRHKVGDELNDIEIGRVLMTLVPYLMHVYPETAELYSVVSVLTLAILDLMRVELGEQVSDSTGDA